MKSRSKSIIAIGSVLVVLGAAFLFVYNLPQGQEKSDFVREEEKWIVSRNDFTKGENLSVGFIPGYNWAWPPHEFTTIDGVEFDRVKLFIVKVTDQTTMNYTEFTIILVIPAPPYDPGKITVHPQIEVTHQGGIVVEDFPREIGGIVEHDGNYTVETSLWPEMVQNTIQEGNDTRTEIEPAVPPTELRLHRIIVETLHPYTYFLIPGSGIAIVGVVILALGIWKYGRKTPRRKTEKGS